MKMQKVLAMILVFVLVAGLLAGCGAAATDAMEMVTNGAVGGAAQESMKETAPMLDSASLADGGESGQSVAPQNQKLIRKIWLNAETEDMDPILASVEERVAQLGGYVESREVYNGSRYSGYTYRNASLTIRIPAQKLDEFVAHVGGQANITSTTETAEDITLTYVATESRMKALQTEQDRLLELLSQAENMEEILQIEKRLTEVRGDLEEVTSKLRVYDNMVDYGTVYLELSEVREYTVIEEEPKGFFQRIGTGFMQGLKNMGKFFTELAIFLIVAIPYVLPFAIIAVVVILLIRRSIKRRRDRKPEKKPFPTDETK